jgi:hypothetical protein
MGQGGLEPPTPRLSSVCSNQLSYWPKSHDPPKRPDPGPLQPGRSPQARSNPASLTTLRSEPGYAVSAQRARAPPGTTRRPVRSTRHHQSTARSMGEIRPRHDPPIRDNQAQAGRHEQAISLVGTQQYQDRPKPIPDRPVSLKGGDPAAGSPTATLLRLHPSR